MNNSVADGIKLDTCYKSIISENKTYLNGTHGVGVINSENIIISTNNFWENIVAGVILSGTKNADIIGNVINNEEYGVRTSSVEAINVLGNSIINTRQGIFLYNSSNCIASSNTIIGSPVYDIQVTDVQAYHVIVAGTLFTRLNVSGSVLLLNMNNRQVT